MKERTTNLIVEFIRGIIIFISGVYSILYGNVLAFIIGLTTVCMVSPSITNCVQELTKKETK